MPADNYSEPRSLFNYESAASYLDLHPGTLRRFVSEGRIEHLKIGRNVRFNQRQLDAFIEVVPATSGASS